MPATTEATRPRPPAAVAPGQPGSGRLRAVHVLVPEEIYWHLRACALESRRPFKDYMKLFLSEAWPYPPPDEGQDGQDGPAGPGPSTATPRPGDSSTGEPAPGVVAAMQVRVERPLAE